VRNGELLTLDQGIPAHRLAEESNGAMQEPPPRKGPMKRKKGAKGQTNGEVPRMHNPINGDAMDIDQNGSTHVTNSVRAESEAMASEVESPTIVEIPISTLSIGQSAKVQTERIVDLAPATLFSCSVKDSEKDVTQTLWGTPDAPLLLAAGKSLLRLYHIPKTSSADTPPPPQTFDLDLPLNNFSITALCWNSHDELTVSAQEERENEMGEIMKTDKLFKMIEGGSDYQVVSSTAGLVTTLRWNQSKQLLLAVSSDGRRGSVKIWKDPGDQQIPAWTAFTDTTIYDAVWIDDSTFAICGIDIFQIHKIADGLIPQRTMVTRITWEKLKYDASSGIIAALGIQGQSSFLAILHPSNPSELQVHEYPDPYFTDLDFQPQSSTNGLGISQDAYPVSSPPVLLATCAASGVARIWDANQPFKCLSRLPISDECQANNIAFSPDGSLVAAAGPDAVTIWELDKREIPVGVWRAQEVDSRNWNPNLDGEFSLAWDPDGSRLSVALGNQVRFPCLTSIQLTMTDPSRSP
jgi:transducin (beta)-like 1